jgi:hypothetical protein
VTPFAQAAFQPLRSALLRVASILPLQATATTTDLAKYLDHARKRRVYSGSHVQRLYGNPGGIDADHFMSSRNSGAHSCAADAGHSMLTLRPLRHSSTRNLPPSIVKSNNSEGVNYNLFFGMYYLFKLAAPVVSCVAIYLGYRLFILGVTGQASLNIESKGLSAQLVNAAPGLCLGLVVSLHWG